VKIRVEDLGVDRDEQCSIMMFALPIHYISSFAFEQIRVMCILSTYLIPLEFNIFERRGAHDRETDQKHISLRVGEWPQSVVVLLKTDSTKFSAYPATRNKTFCSQVLEEIKHITCPAVSQRPNVTGLSSTCIKFLVVSPLHQRKKLERQLVRITDHDVGGVVIKDSGNVVLGEGIGCVADEHARFADCTITYHHTLDRPHLSCLHENTWRARTRAHLQSGLLAGGGILRRLLSL